ncbi:EthD family reductase [Aromatoleum bremense]|uniref:EthD family reductase n=1 Tax=Aromatoleum bremense TaxID=76115 RepID=A0ABX1NZM0_9RHOO|nr:EthD family reductase [Aromatoleum bremense]
MVKQLLGIACKRIDVDHGLAGAQPELSATFAAMAHLTFDSVDAFQTAFGPNAEAIMRDLPMFTNINPTIQISDAVI